MRALAQTSGGKARSGTDGSYTRSSEGAGALPFLFVFFFFGWAQTGRWTQRFAVVVERQVADVQRQHAPWRLLVDDDGDRAAFDAVAERDAASTSEPCVREPFQHQRAIIARPH